MRFTLLVVLSLVVTATVTAGSTPPPAETHVISTGSAPCGTAVGASGVWVGVYDTGKLLRLDPETGRVTRRIAVGRWACRVALDGKAAWVTRDNAAEVVRIDLETGRRVRYAVEGMPFDVVVAGGSVWVTTFDTGTIARIDPATGEVVRVYEDGANPAGITSCRGRVWVGHGRDSTWLTSVDPATHRVRRLEVGTKEPGWPRCVRGELWVTAGGTVVRVDARSGKVLGRVRVGGTTAEAAAGPDGLVWVTNKERSLVHRIFRKRLVVESSFPAGPGAYSLVRAGDAMWITSFAGSDVRRYDP